jgi:hypothetical protein
MSAPRSSGATFDDIHAAVQNFRPLIRGHRVRQVIRRGCSEALLSYGVENGLRQTGQRYAR